MTKIISVEPDSTVAHYNLGKIYIYAGNKDLALEEYETLQTLDDELANELLGLINE